MKLGFQKKKKEKEIKEYGTVLESDFAGKSGSKFIISVI